MKQKELTSLLVLLMVTCSVMSLFYIIKFKKSSFSPSYDEYYHLSSISKIKDMEGLKIEDVMRNENNFYILDYFLAKFDNALFLMRIFSFLSGIFFIACCYIFLRKFIDDESQVFFNVLIIALSPVFIYAHVTYNEIFLELFLLCIGSLFLLENKYLSSLLTFILAFFTSQRQFIIILFILIFFYAKLRGRGAFIPFICIIATTYIFINMNNLQYPELSLHALFTTYFSDLGSSLGFGVFSFILFCIGISLSWKNKKENFLLYCMTAMIFLSLLYDTNIIFFLDLVISYYAALALSRIWKSEWESPLLKNYVILLVFCGLIFSSGAYINSFSKKGPDYAETISLEWLKDKGDGKVLSYYDYGFFIGAVSQKEVYTDKRYFSISKERFRIKESERVLGSRDLENISLFFEKANIRYVWVNRKMKEGLVWEKNGEGLLFVMENSLRFKKIYDYLGIEIWEYISLKS